MIAHVQEDIIIQDREVIADVVRQIIQCEIEMRCRLTHTAMPPRIGFVDRRSSPRSLLEVPVFLTPVHWDGVSLEVTGETVMGLTKDLSIEGVGLSFDKNIRSMLVAAEFDVQDLVPATLLVELRWRHRLSRHSYRGGGQLVGLLATGR